MKITASNMMTHTSGPTLSLERGPSIRRMNVNYEYVREPVFVQRPQIEDFNSLVVVHERVEYYS